MTSERDFQEIPLASAWRIATYSLHDDKHFQIQISQTRHRIRLANSWRTTTPGSRVLEIGCGQGDCTAVLASAVGPAGHVDAVDPARRDYGAPYTLEQAQSHLSASVMGRRISWHQADPVEFAVSKPDGAWDVAVLAHCIWYFRSPGTLRDILAALRGKAKRVCIAEYALQATEHAAVPHLLAALARGTLEAHKSRSYENIQTPLSPAGIRSALEEAGWVVDHDGLLVPEAGLLDGQWEAGTVASDAFGNEIRNDLGDGTDRVQALLRSARDATITAVSAAGGLKEVRTMDVWYASCR